MIINYLLFFAVYTYLKKRNINKYTPNEGFSQNIEVLKGMGISLLIMIVAIAIMVKFIGAKIIIIEGEVFPLIDLITLTITYFGVSLFEESLFRCAIFEAMRKRINLPLSMILTNAVFAMSHYFSYSRHDDKIYLYLFAFVIGLLFQYIYIKKDSLLIPIGMHTCLNIVETMFVADSVNYARSNIYIDATVSRAFFDLTSIGVILVFFIIIIAYYKIKESRVKDMAIE